MSMYGKIMGPSKGFFLHARIYELSFFTNFIRLAKVRIKNVKLRKVITLKSCILLYSDVTIERRS